MNEPNGMPARLTTPSAYQPGAVSNDDIELTPQPSPGSSVVPFDFPGVFVGTAEYAEGPTGCTVIHVPQGARTAVDARGGAVGLSGGYNYHEAIVLAGGSVYGLAAAAGVNTELLHRVQNRTYWAALQHVSGAVIYDFSVRDTAIAPDTELGKAALRNAVAGEFPVGRCGAGRSASVGKIDLARAEFAGQGAAYGQYGELKVLVATVVNAIGVIVDRNGTVVRGNYHADTGKRQLPTVDFAAAAEGADVARTASGNTTLTVVLTNAKLSDVELNQFATQVHSSMNRAIQPFHTERDGDTLFALTTDEVAPAAVGGVGLGSLASELAWDAVLASAR
ncbi:L-aminopeptidase/D-esterase-like protein [Tamaricihabitans halophyticus]|uniref:L-aminopeptidase/D-esterase-like protein n=1 Tax=Tamaricihabitans halophyticus TaxID=1262583 RepID=A0A4R2QSB6_9PSEU|nr:P1 family peptidase [Tamaricihabitans halophyticus]TCP49941.1 L-aminopeptidase/D-esterase-like protein [Tamaricihabitans halophyticus]